VSGFRREEESFAKDRDGACEERRSESFQERKGGFAKRNNVARTRIS